MNKQRPLAATANLTGPRRSVPLALYMSSSFFFSPYFFRFFWPTVCDVGGSRSNGWMDRDAVWRSDLWGPKTDGVPIPHGEGRGWGRLATDRSAIPALAELLLLNFAKAVCHDLF